MSFGKGNVTCASDENLSNTRNNGSFTHQNSNDKNPKINSPKIRLLKCDEIGSDRSLVLFTFYFPTSEHHDPKQNCH